VSLDLLIAVLASGEESNRLTYTYLTNSPEMSLDLLIAVLASGEHCLGLEGLVGVQVVVRIAVDLFHVGPQVLKD